MNWDIGTLYWFAVAATAVAGVAWLYAAFRIQAWNNDPRGRAELGALAKKAKTRAILWTATAAAAWGTWAIWSAQ